MDRLATIKARWAECNTVDTGARFFWAQEDVGWLIAELEAARRGGLTRLHRTPTHVAMLRAVLDDQIVWDREVGPPDNAGGFRYADGTRIQPGNDLVALYQLRDSGLIEVAVPQVKVTNAGGARLHDWQVQS